MAIEANFNSLIFLKKFNNYFNRKVIGFAALANYLSGHEYQRRDNVNFNPNEGTLSEIVINDLPFEPDYCLVLGTNDEIISRWFVIETKRTRKAQAHISLKRDVIYDYLPELLDAPIYVHKAMLEETDPFILNSEGMSLNQIKVKESLLQDGLKSPWLIVYFAKDLETTAITTEHFTFSFPSNYISSAHKTREPYNAVAFPYGDFIYHYSFISGDDNTSQMAINQKEYALEIVRGIIENCGSAIYDVQLLPFCPCPQGIIKTDTIGAHFWPTINSKFYPQFYKGKDYNISSPSGAYLMMKEFSLEYYTVAGQLYAKYTKYLSLGEVGLFCAKTIDYFRKDVTPNYAVTNEGTSIAYDSPLFTELNVNEVRNNAIDMIEGFNIEIIYQVTGNLDKNKLAYFEASIRIGTGGGDSNDGSKNTHATFGILVENCNFETNLEPSDTNLVDNESLKVLSNCYLYRLVSPNYQGGFDLNIGKNGGKIEDLKAYCSYKPFTPMIKVEPKFNLLYGRNFKDDRGLVMNNNFSITMITSAWVEYQLQNKNYQNIFNRDMQNLDFNQDIAMREAVVGGVVGTMQGALAGAAAGGMAAGAIYAPVGAAAGAAIGAAASGIAAAADIEFLGMKQKEERSYAIDKYNYQLGNIKAVPSTLTKVTSFDIINKIYPFIEKYSCTDKELQAFKDKIKYESMTVMRIDKMRNFYNKHEQLCYFKGELIRTDDIAADSHIVDVIYQELMKGVFL